MKEMFKTSLLSAVWQSQKSSLRSFVRKCIIVLLSMMLVSPIMAQEYVTFTAGDAAVTVSLGGSNPSNWTGLQYWTGKKWSDLTTYTIPARGSVRIKAKSDNPTFYTNNSQYRYFVITGGTVSISGKIGALLHQYNPGQTAASCYRRMFYNCDKLVSAENLELPTNLSDYCFQEMFLGCTGLTSAPKFKSGDWKPGCYQSMFEGCTNLKTPPTMDLSNVYTFGQSCCQSMFKGSGLQTAPELCDKIAQSCYQSMFQDCKSLKTAPVLKSNSLATSCYQSMFQGSGLTEAPDLTGVKQLANSCFKSMFQDCDALTEAPLLETADGKAHTLAASCYESMFQGCDELTSTPELKATSLQSNCYKNMFKDCAKLTEVTVSFTGWGTGNTQYTDGWLSGVASKGSFSCPKALSWVRGASNIPSGWNVISEGVKMDYLCFTSTCQNEVYISLITPNSKPTNTISLVYSKTPNDDSSWKTLNIGQHLAVDLREGIFFGNYVAKREWGFELNPGETVYIRALDKNKTFSQSNTKYYGFSVIERGSSATGAVDISGNVLSLLDASCLQTEVPEYAFYSLFNSGNAGWTVQLVTGLISALGGQTYTYASFHAAPDLPATELGQYCYAYMFNGCDQLNSAPRLPAQRLAKGCYEGMFSGCSGINYINVGFTDWKAYNDEGNVVSGNVPTSGWTENVASNGTFICPSGLELKYSADIDDPANSYIPWKPGSGSTNKVDTIGLNNDYLCFDITTTSGSVQLIKDGTNAGSLADPNLVWSRDGITWYTYGWNGTKGDIITLDRSDRTQYRVYFRAGKIQGGAYAAADNATFSTAYQSFFHFKLVGNINASGNIMSLLKGDCKLYTLPQNYIFCRLFEDAKTLGKAPKLPATSLTSNCYRNMFMGCSSLASAPALPAKILKGSCYWNMFNGCTSLSTMPELPATSLAGACYRGMFQGCTNLTKVPNLPATKLADECYWDMFNGCTKLNFIKVDFLAWNKDESEYDTSNEDTKKATSPYTYNWVKGVPAGGLFSCPSGLLLEYGDCRIPTSSEHWKSTKENSNEDWLCFMADANGATIQLEVVDKKGDDIDVTTSKVAVMYSTDNGGNWRTYDWNGTGSTVTRGEKITVNKDDVCNRVYFKAPGSGSGRFSANADNYYRFRLTKSFSVSGNVMSLLKDDCDLNIVPSGAFASLFSDCGVLRKAPNLPADTVMNSGYSSMFKNCTGLTDAPDLPATVIADSSYFSMFRGCTNLEKVPTVLPAASLDTACYRLMFSECSSITTAPELPAEHVCYQSYDNMFRGCSNLNYISVGLKNWDGSGTSNWVSDYTSNSVVVSPFSESGLFFAPNMINPKDIVFGPSRVPKNQTYPWIVNSPYLTFTSTEHAYVWLDKSNKALESVKLVYSTDKGNTWKQYGWTDGTTNAVGDTLEIQPNGVVYLRAGHLNGDGTVNSVTNEHFSNDTKYYQFRMQGEVYASGDIMSLLKEDAKDVNGDTLAISDNYMFYNLFYGCATLKSAPRLSSNSLKPNCYRGMFQNCEELSVLPALPARALETGCYRDMFAGSGITRMPDLPATTLATYCYAGMFSGCVHLQETSPLDATTLKGYCYQNMFSGCTSLGAAPDLPAENLETGCYAGMFSGCTSLSAISVAFTSWGDGTATTGWVTNVVDEGMFFCPTELVEGISNSADWYNANKVPKVNEDGKRWKVNPSDYLVFKALEPSSIALKKVGTDFSNAARIDVRKPGSRKFVNYTFGEVIPMAKNNVVIFKATTSNSTFSESDSKYYQFVMGNGKIEASGNVKHMLGSGDGSIPSFAFYNLFKDCKTMTTAPQIPSNMNCATYCYAYMFCNDTSLVAPPVLQDLGLSLANYCYAGMFSGCKNMTTAPTLLSSNIVEGCYKEMFKGCKSLLVAPTLSLGNIKNTIAPYCFQSMFEGCESITEAATFPVADQWNQLKISNSCFKSMYKGCTSLRSARILPLYTANPQESCYECMFDSCVSLTEAPTISATQLATNCYRRMFANCYSLRTAPELPAKKEGLAAGCYEEMFMNCRSLRYMDVGFNQWVEMNGVLVTKDWVAGVAPAGTFMCPDGLEKDPNNWIPAQSYDSHIPKGWSTEDNGNYFCIEIINGQTGQIQFVRHDNAEEVVIKYSTDNRESWKSIVSSSYNGDLNNFSGTVYLKTSDGRLSQSETKYWSITCSVDCHVSGDITSLIDGSMDKSDVPAYTFYKLFDGMNEKLKSIDGLKLPATEVGDYAYADMFYSCSYLKKNASVAPELPATKVGKYCYKNLFSGWSKLKKSPELPADTIAEGCYSGMFQNCTSLKSAPALPAKELSEHCYENMFNGCTSLDSINVSFTSWAIENATTGWVTDVVNKGHFECPWALLNYVSSTWGIANAYGPNRIPKYGDRGNDYKWVIFLHTDMEMDYSTGLLTLGGGDRIYYKQDVKISSIDDVDDGDLYDPENPIDLNAWLNSASKLDSTTFYAIATNTLGVGTPTVNQLTVYRMPRRAGYILASNGPDLKEALYYASKVSSNKYRVRIFCPNGNYDMGDKAQPVGQYVTLAGESCANTRLTSSSAFGVLDIQGPNTYVQDMNLASSAADGYSFVDNGVNSTLHVTTNKQYKVYHPFEGTRAQVTSWTYSDAADQVSVNSVSVNGSTLSIDADAPAYFVRIAGLGYTLSNSKNLYITADMSASDLTVRAANSRGAFGPACDISNIIVADEGASNKLYTGLGSEVKLNTSGYASFSYHDDNIKYLRAYGASAYAAVFDAEQMVIRLSHLNEYDIIPRHAGVIFFGAPGTVVKLYNDVDEGNIPSMAPNDLIGNYSGSTMQNSATPDGDKIGFPDINGTIYVLKDNTFKYLNPNGTLRNNRAYLDLPVSIAAAASALRICFDWFDFDEEEEETGIHELLFKGMRASEGYVYNLHGQRTNQKSGLMIKNGKVIMVK